MKVDSDQKNGSHLFDSVFETLLSRGIQPGFATRISLCNKVLRKTLVEHNYYWKHISKEKFGWTRHKENKSVIDMFSHNRKCRECGSKKCYSTKTSLDTCVWLCLDCTSDESGYSHLCTRKTIFNGKEIWSHKRRIVKNLTLAKRGMARKHMYWMYEVKKYRIMSVLKNRRILPF